MPLRQSSRIRGEAAPSTQQAAAVAQREAAEEEEEGLGRTKKGTSRRRLTLDEGIAYAAPFTLWSIGESSTHCWPAMLGTGVGDGPRAWQQCRAGTEGRHGPSWCHK